MNHTYKDLRKANNKNRFKFLLNDSIVFGGASAVTKLLMLFTFPILTRVFIEAEFGVIDGLTYLGNIIIPLMILGQDSAVARYFYEIEDEEKKKQLISQSFAFVIGVSLFTVTVAFIFSKGITEWYLNTPDYQLAFQILLIALPFRVIQLFGINILKWTLARKQFLIVTLGSVIFNVLLTILFVVVLKWGIVSIFYAQLISFVFFGSLGIYFIRSYLTWITNYDYIKRLLRYGLPYTASGFLLMVILSVDRYVISNHISLTMLGVYAVAYKVSSFLQFITVGFQTAWGPFALSIYKEENAKETYNKVFFYFTIFIIIISLGMIFSAKVLIFIFAGSKYNASLPLIAPLIFATIINSLTLITSLGIDLSKKTEYFIYSNVITFLFGGATIYFLGKNYGVMGVAMGFLISRIIYWASTTFFAFKVFPLRFDLVKPVILLMISFAGSFFLSNLIYPITIWLQIVIVTCILTIIPFFIWKFYIDKTDKTKILSAVNNFRKKKKTPIPTNV